MTCAYANCTAPQIAARLTSEPILCLPAGSTEQHGPHPLGTDSIIAERLAAAIAEYVARSGSCQEDPDYAASRHRSWTCCLAAAHRSPAGLRAVDVARRITRMPTSLKSMITSLVCGVEPTDDLGREHGRNALSWLAGTDDIFRWVKPRGSAAPC
jgi:Creatinine amidohydrolase